MPWRRRPFGADRRRRGCPGKCAKDVLGLQQRAVGVDRLGFGGLHFHLCQVGVDPRQITGLVATLDFACQRARGLQATRRQAGPIARCGQRPPRLAQRAGEFQAQGGAPGADFIEAALGLGFARRFLSGQPQVGVQLDGDLAFAAIAVQLVVERADADRPRLRRQPGGQFLRRARFALAGVQLLSPADFLATPVRARIPGCLPAPLAAKRPFPTGSVAHRPGTLPSAMASTRRAASAASAPDQGLLSFHGW
jgi:hypothetical protein